MRVFIIGRAFPTPENSMLGIFEFDQAKALFAAGHEVVFLALDLRSVRRIRKFGFRNFDDSGIKVCTADIPVGNVPDGLFIKIGSSALFTLYKKAVELYGKPDIIHSHFAEISACAAYVSEKSCVPLVVTEHSSVILTSAQAGKVVPAVKRAYEAASCVIAVSKGFAQLIEKYYGVNTEYVPNIIDTSLFYPVEQKPHDCFTFVSVGNLIESKRHDLTITAFKKAFYGDTDNICTPRLIIIGGGEQECSLKALAESLGISDYVSFTGKISRKEIAEILCTADCFVLPSRFETFGVAYVEAMAAGLPVITAKCCGTESFVNDSNGIIISVDDEAALVASMLKMFKEAHKRFNSAEIKEATATEFSPSAISARITEIYVKVIKEKG